MQEYTSSIYQYYSNLPHLYSYKLEFCEDGTVMTLYFEDTWKTSTLNKKDASQSFYFSKKSFDELFWEAFPEEAKIHLDESKIYKFILLHPENRLVVKHQIPQLVLIEDSDSPVLFNYFRGPQKMPELASPPSIQYLENFSNPHFRGIIIKIENTIYKYDFYYYTFISKVRGNNKNISIRYLQLLKNREMLDILVTEYFEWIDEFFLLELQLEKLYDYLYKMYVTIFIEHVKIENLHAITLNALKSIHYHSKKTTFCIDTVKYAVANLKNCSYQINKLFILADISKDDSLHF